MSIDARIARQVRSLRKDRRYTLDQLAKASGVSRSMISLIEREETSPSAAVLHKLADAMGISLAELFSSMPQNEPARPVSRLSEQTLWEDPASGYLRRQVSPSGADTSVKLVEVIFPPGEKVAFDDFSHTASNRQQVWMLEGEMSISTAGETWNLKSGDCLAMVQDQPVVFYNPTRAKSRYLVVISD